MPSVPNAGNRASNAELHYFKVVTDGTRSAEKLLAQTYRRFLLGWSVIENLRSLTEANQAQTHEIAAVRSATALSWMETNEDYQFFAGPPISESSKRQMVTAMTQGSMESYIGSINAACLVFWHSVLDAATTDLLRVIAMAAPDSWDSELANKEISFERATTQSVEDLRKQLLDELIGKLKRNSLPKRVHQIYARCSPESNWSNLRDYSYDSRELERIDKLRHGIVHRDGLHEAAQLDPSDTDYLRSTTLHLIYLVAYHFHLQVEIVDVYGSPEGASTPKTPKEF